MPINSFKKKFKWYYVSLVLLVSLSIGVVGINLEKFDSITMFIALVLMLAITSYVYFSSGKITFYENHIELDRKIIKKEKILSIHTFETIVPRRGYKKFLNIHYRIGKIEGNDEEIEISLYDESSIEQYIESWCKQNNIKFERRGKMA